MPITQRSRPHKYYISTYKTVQQGIRRNDKQTKYQDQRKSEVRQRTGLRTKFHSKTRLQIEVKYLCAGVLLTHAHCTCLSQWFHLPFVPFGSFICSPLSLLSTIISFYASMQFDKCWEISLIVRDLIWTSKMAALFNKQINKWKSHKFK